MGLWSKFQGTNQFGLISNKLNLELHLASLHLGSSNHELSFLALCFFGSNQLIFPPKWCHVGLALICQFLVLDPHLKTNLSFSSNRIALFCQTLDPHLKWPLAYLEAIVEFLKYSDWGCWSPSFQKNYYFDKFSQTLVMGTLITIIKPAILCTRKSQFGTKDIYV